MGSAPIPGLVDCHTHPAFAGDRAHEFALRAAGATYEELLAAGGGILSTTRATRAAGPHALREVVARHRDAMLAHGTTTFEGKSGYGLDHDTELAQLEAVRDAGGVPTWLGAHAVPPEHADADAYVDWLIAEVLPDAARIAVAADVFVERGTFDVEQARRYLLACREAGLALAVARRPALRDRRRAARRRARCALGRPSGGDRARRGSRRSPQATSSASCCPSPRSTSAGRCRPPARSSDAGAAIALATDFNPGSAYCESLPVVSTLACTQLGLTPAEALSACTVNAAYVLGLPDRGRLAPGLRADVVLARRPRLAAPRVSPRRRHRPHRRPRGSDRPFAGIIESMANQKQRRRRAKEKRHAYDLVEIDAEGNETVLSATELKTEAVTEEPGEEDPAARADEAEARPGHAATAVVAARPEARRDLRADLSRDRPPARRQPAQLAGAVVQTLFLLAIFVPFSYFMDRLVWRSHEKRQAREASPLGNAEQLPARAKAQFGVSPSR